MHGIAEAALQGGASGAIVVEGITAYEPATANVPQRILLVRDQVVAGVPAPGGRVPSWDLTMNYVPIAYPRERPAVIKIGPNAHEFWRIVNASADSILDLSVSYDGVAQPLRVVAFDGVAIGSQDGTSRGATLQRTSILLPPAGRVEFLLDGPSPEVKSAVVQTSKIKTGPAGDDDPKRTLAALEVLPQAPMLPVESQGEVQSTSRFQRLNQATSTVYRKLYFSEVISDPSNPASPTNFFLTVDGQAPLLFDPNNPPAIITHEGAIETWTIENRSPENHVFHIHQIHFLLIGADNISLPLAQQQYYDTYQVPFWPGYGPYPSITVRMDFRGAISGDFLYHCHILGHEDNGMMAVIRVKPHS